MEVLIYAFLISFALAIIYVMADDLIENRQADERLQKGDEWLDKK